MSRMYTDEELCWATQVAYCNVTQLDITQHREEHNGEYPTLQEIFNKHGYAIYYNQSLIVDDQVGDKLVMQQTAMEFIDAVKAGTICQGWRAIAVSNEEHQNETGFRAITIATSEEDAIVGFRGSESWNMNQLVEDWVVADFTMLASELTEQETLAGEYLYNTIADTDFENFAVTGHSLGGNLSIISTVLTKNKDNKCGTDMASRIKQTVSFDGPGHPDEFIEQFRTEIDQMADVMTHYQWSWVGAILTSLCEENGTYIKKKSDTFHTDITSMFKKHSTASLEFDENGMLADAEYGTFEGAIHLITNFVDDVEAVQDFLASLINCVAVNGENLCDLQEMASQEGKASQVVDYYDKFYTMCIDMAVVTAYINNPAVWIALYPDSDIPFGNLSTSIKECYEAANLAFGDGFGLQIVETIFDSMVAGLQVKPIDFSLMLVKELCDVFLYVIEEVNNTELGAWFLQEGIVQLTVMTSPLGLPIKVGEYAYNNYQDAKKNEYQSIADSLADDSLRKVLQQFQANFANQLSKDDESLNKVLETCSTKDAITYRRRHVRMVHDNAYIQTLAQNPEVWDALSGGGEPFAALRDSTRSYLETVEQILANISDPEVQAALTGHKDAIISMVQETSELVALANKNSAAERAGSLAIWESLRCIDQICEQASGLRRVHPDPLVFDMDGDGYEILDVEDGVYFDEDNVDLTEKTQWVDADDALLAMDLNGDGIINDGSELFGSSTVLADGSLAKTGFEALAQYDSNGDMVIDEQDEKFFEMLLWQDANTDGISQANELYTLEQVGVESISLNSSAESGVNSADVIMADGTVTRMGEFAFASELYNTKGENMEISEEIQGLPNVQAMGRLESLHTMMQLDETGTLKEYVTAFTQAATKAEREQLVTDILYFITGADAVAAGSRGNEFDAKKLHVIEQVLGRDFVGTEGSNPVNSAAELLREVYDSIYELYYNMLGGQTFLKEYLDMTFWSTNAEGETYLNTALFDIYALCEMNHGQDMVEAVGEMGRYIAAVNRSNEANLTEYMWYYADHTAYFTAIAEHSSQSMVLGTDGGETLRDGTESSVLVGFDGDDSLFGNNGDDELYGQEGADFLYGEYGNDLIDGGAGDDILDGGAGNDTYVYGRGSGNDLLQNYTSNNSDMDIVRLEGLKREDVSIEVMDNDLVIRILDTGETLRIDRFFRDGIWTVEKLVFADGSEITAGELINGHFIKEGTEGADTISLSHVNGNVSVYGRGGNDTVYGSGRADKLYGGEGADILNGNNGDDFLYGEAGADQLYGGYGNDLIDGGEGNDILDGGAGNDTYVFGRGSGNDTLSNLSSGSDDMDIVSFEGLNRDEVSIEIVDNDLVVRILDTGETLRIDRFFRDGFWTVEKLVFADGSEITAGELINGNFIKDGTADADTISLSHVNGNVSVYGRGGNDTVYGSGRADKLYGGEGADTLNGNNGDDLLYGEAGADQLYGGYGNDLIDGGEGNDILDGGAGNDTYVYGRGSGNDTLSNLSSGSDDMDIVSFEGLNRDEVSIEIVDNDLVIKILDTGETLRIDRFFRDGIWTVEKLVFADGSEITAGELINGHFIKEGTEGADTISLSHVNGNVSVYGRGGNDTVYGSGRADKLYGGEGADTLNGNNGDDFLYGEAGADQLYGGYGNDLIDGGEGNDILDGGAGNDTYVYGRCSGNDTLSNLSSGSDDMDIVSFEGLNRDEVSIEIVDNDLVVRILDTGETLRIDRFFRDGFWTVEKLGFADGSEITAGELINGDFIKDGTADADTISLSHVNGNVSVYGRGGNDTVYGSGRADKLYGGEGADTLNGNNGDDLLYGEAGADQLYGGYGNDLIDGGEGNDILDGGAGNDTYVFGRGSGNDILQNCTSLSSDTDVVEVAANAEDIIFERSGNNLLVSILGESDTLTIERWYNGDGFQVEAVNTCDGYTLSKTQVDQLIQAMASYESTSGMSWAEGVRSNDETVNQLVSQMWIKQEVV